MARTRTSVRLMMAVVVLALGGAGLAACSSSSAPSGTSSGSATTRPTSGGSSPTSTSGSSSTTSTASGGPARCSISGLSGAIEGSSGAAGTIQVTIALKNTSAGPCILGGYPGLLMLGSGGAPLPTNVVRKGGYSFTSMAPTTVTLAAGSSTYFNIGYSDVTVGSETSCPSSSSLEITPPGAYDHLTIAATLDPCGNGTVVVSPVFAATGSDTQFTAPSASSPSHPSN